MEPEVKLQIILLKPTAGVIFGLQEGSGNNYETVQKQQANNNDLVFTFSVKVKGDSSKDKLPKFSGSYVQGPSDNKFVYIDIGTAAGEMQRSLDNATPIATIANIDSVWVVGDIFERDLGSVTPGREVKIDVPAYAGLGLSGRIANVGDALDPNTHTLKLRVVLPNPKHTLKTDMFATIRIPGAARSAIVLPATAVLHEGEKTSVFVVNAAGKYEQHPVTIGRTFDSGPTKSIEVLTGINDGEKVVTSGGALLRPSNGE